MSTRLMILLSMTLLVFDACTLFGTKKACHDGTECFDEEFCNESGFCTLRPENESDVAIDLPDVLVVDVSTSEDVALSTVDAAVADSAPPDVVIVQDVAPPDASPPDAATPDVNRLDVVPVDVLPGDVSVVEPPCGGLSLVAHDFTTADPPVSFNVFETPPVEQDQGEFRVTLLENDVGYTGARTANYFLLNESVTFEVLEVGAPVPGVDANLALINRQNDRAGFTFNSGLLNAFTRIDNAEVNYFQGPVDLASQRFLRIRAVGEDMFFERAAERDGEYVVLGSAPLFPGVVRVSLAGGTSIPVAAPGQVRFGPVNAGVSSGQFCAEEIDDSFGRYLDSELFDERYINGTNAGCAYRYEENAAITSESLLCSTRTRRLYDLSHATVRFHIAPTINPAVGNDRFVRVSRQASNDNGLEVVFSNTGGRVRLRTDTSTAGGQSFTGEVTMVEISPGLPENVRVTTRAETFVFGIADTTDYGATRPEFGIVNADNSRLEIERLEVEQVAP